MEFRILGPLEVVEDHNHVPLGPEKQRAVLALLLLSAGHAVAVDRLIDGLWGDEPPESPVKAIQTYVSRLRKVLPPNRLCTRPPGYAIDVHPGELDLVRFELLLDEGRRTLTGGEPEQARTTLQDALRLWRGPALAEFGSEPFAVSESARLEELRLLALEARIEADLELGRHADVVGELELLVARNPLRERFCGQLMLALYRSGRQAEALSAYRDGRSFLVDRLGVEPSRSLHHLERAILRQDPSLDLTRRLGASAAVAARGREGKPGAFVGREHELERLTEALEDALAGRGRLVLLSGEQGIGKTRVAMELADRAEQRGARVLWGRCYEREGAPPYWPWVQVIRAYLKSCDVELLGSELQRPAAVVAEIVPEVRELVPGLDAPPTVRDPEEARFRLLDSVASFLTRAARTQPIAIVLDNLHASDAGSLLLLEFVARELADAPLLVIGTYRDVELTRGHRLVETLAELTREHRFQRLPLHGLTEADVTQLIEESVDVRSSPELAQRIHEQTEGNPLFVTEVVRLFVEEQTVSRPGRPQGRDWSIRVPEGVRVVIGRRLDRLSPECNDVLRLAAITGREFGLDQLRAVVDDRPEDSLLRVLVEALDAHVLEEPRDAADRYRFSHRLVQDTLLGELSTTARVRLHARVAETLERLYGDAADAHAAELVRHFGEAETVLGREGLVRYSRIAGEQALLAHAFEEALEHFQRALDAKEGLPVDDETALLLFGLARSEFAVRERYDLGDALDHLRCAFEHFAESGDERTAVEIAVHPIPYVYGWPEAADLAARALALVPPSSAEAGYLLSTLGWFTGMKDRAAARDAFSRSAEIARNLGDTALERRELISEAHVAFWHLDYGECLEKAMAAVALARRALDERTEMMALSEVTRMYATTGRPAEADMHARRMAGLAERFRERYWLVTARVNRIWLAALTGDWEVAQALGDEALHLQPRDARSLTSLALIAGEVGQDDQVAAYVARLLEARSLSSTGFSFEDACAAAALPLIAWSAGTVERLDVAEEAAQTVLSREFVLPLLDLYVQTGRGFSALVLGDAARARESHGALLHLSGTALAPLALSADRLLALLSAAAGDAKVAASHFEAALRFCRSAEYRPQFAWTAAEYADLLRAGDDEDDRRRAEVLEGEAVAVATELGMRRLLHHRLRLRNT